MLIEIEEQKLTRVDKIHKERVNLILAAPDLLEALQAMIDWANCDPSGTYPGGYPGTKAAAAINKALGNT